MSKIFNCSLDYLLKDEIENMDVNLESSKEDARYNKILSIFFTFISFAPIFGFIFGIVSIIRQVKNEKNKLLISLSILGTIVSLALTVLMIVGIVLNK